MESSIISTQVIIVGAGPIGLELAAAFTRQGINYLQFDAHQIGYTLSWWPRNTLFFSTTERIEIAGIPIANTTQQRQTGEEYLAYLRSVVELLDLQVNTYEPVLSIERQPGGVKPSDGSKSSEGFIVRTSPPVGEKVYFCRQVVLANGDMDYPNRLGIPGEDLPHVSHYFTDPHLYFRKRLLIVGGRNSAVEAALRCWRAGSRVTLSYRQNKFNEQAVKHWLLPDLQTQIQLGTIGFIPRSRPIEITPSTTILEQVREDGGLMRLEHPADFVLLSTGFAADTRLLESTGVRLVGEQRSPDFNPETMETNVPGVYVAGTVAAGTQRQYRLFIENCHEHVSKIVKALTGRWPEQVGTIPERQYEPPFEDIKTN